VVTATPVSFSEFGSNVEDDAVAWFTNEVPGAVSVGMLNVNVKVAELPFVRVAMLQLMETGGGVQVKVGPLFCTMLTNVMPAGTASLRLTAVASLGPKLKRLTV
jgi:hypothetical protein